MTPAAVSDLAVVEWSRPDGQHTVHAFAAGTRPERSLCGSALPPVHPQRSGSGPSCRDCTDIVHRAERHLSEIVATMRNEIPECELRALWGDR